MDKKFKFYHVFGLQRAASFKKDQRVKKKQFTSADELKSYSHKSNGDLLSPEAPLPDLI